MKTAIAVVFCFASYGVVVFSVAFREGQAKQRAECQPKFTGWMSAPEAVWIPKCELRGDLVTCIIGHVVDIMPASQAAPGWVLKKEHPLLGVHQ